MSVANPQGRGVHRPGRGGDKGRQRERTIGLYWPTRSTLRVWRRWGPCLCCALGLFAGGHVHPDGTRA